MASTSEIIILKSALENNVKFVKSILKNSDTIVSAVIKGNAYGHGVNITLPEMEKAGINHFSVYSSSGAYKALKVKQKNTTVMIMGFVHPDDYKWIIENEIEFYVSEMVELEYAINTARKLGKKAIIHVDVETGMNRTGLQLATLKRAVKIINKFSEHLIVRGVTSHFAGAESIANHQRIKKQFSTFKKRVKLLNEYGIFPELKHIASSAATVNYPDTQLDLVRTGVMLYGYWPTRETFIQYIHRKKDKSDPLNRALVWKSYVATIKTVPEGEFVGYGLSFQAQHDMTIMILPVGYSNGYSRSLSINGRVIVNEQFAPVIGSVNMNMIICDITNIGSIKIGDEVVLIGKQGENEISFSSFAEMNNSLNYEILARLPENIPRSAR